uniref:Transposable element P transposase-like RNase H C-terminal domain-containing protein n=1 Tax=Amphimedon queenslandica TaxID=400682 RepID=A0A1X7VRV3_AMPQE
MCVNLAAQVLCESVSNVIKLTGGPQATETSKFSLMFDMFFDTMNVTKFRSGKKSRKSFRVPYSNAQDERLKKEFVPYLDAWQATVDKRTDCTKAQKKRMLRSDETLLGIRRTVKSFVEFILYLFSLPEVKDLILEFLSNHMCLDHIESFFSCGRQRGGRSDNPSVSEFFNDTQAFRVIDSFCQGPVRGNCRGGTPGKKRAMNQNME